MNRSLAFLVPIALAAAGALLAAAPAVAAAVTAHACTQFQDYPTDPFVPAPVCDVHDSAGIPVVSSNADSGSSMTIGSGLGFATILANSDAQLNSVAGHAIYAASTGYAQWDDSWTISASPALAGTPGTATFLISVNATLSVSDLQPGFPAGCSQIYGCSSASTDWQLDVATGVNGSGGPFSRTEFRESQSTGAGGPVHVGNSGTFPVVLPFVFGELQDFQVYFHGETFAWANTSTALYSPHSSALLDASHTVEWQGISQVVDANGDPVEFNMTSGSGVDWTQPVLAPVPLPSAGFLFPTAFMALRRQVRRRLTR